MLQKPDLKVNTQLCLQLADFVESLPDREPELFTSGAVYEVFSPTKPDYFSMRVFHRTEECGTIACLCGSLAYLTNCDELLESFEEAGKRLGISLAQAKQLFTPVGWPNSKITSQEAARVMRHLAITGEVDWGILNKEGEDGREQDSNSV